MAVDRYDTSVFINWPFDDAYQPLFRALVFTVVECGYTPRCALEVSDGAAVRIDRIYSLIEACRLAVHDLSRIGLDNGFPRFNMPLELGIFLGARRYGGKRQRRKSCIIFEQEPNSYDRYCSDISGQDIRAHRGDVQHAVRAIRTWLRNDASTSVLLPGDERIVARLGEFLSQLPQICLSHGLEPDNLIFRDYFALVAGWKDANPL